MLFLYQFAFFYTLHQVSLLSYVSCLTPENIHELLHIHNFYRRRLASRRPPFSIANMKELVWSNRLASTAAEAVTCFSWRAAHAQRLSQQFQNINVGRRRPMAEGTLSKIVRRWFSQRSLFLPSENSCFPWDQCNDFRNIVNAKHRNLGCAAVDDCGRQSHLLVLMCLYEGGSAEEFDFQLGPPCTSCSRPSSFCRSNLCVACDSRRDECDCRKTCRKEGVGLGSLEAASCTCTCFYGNGPNCDQPCQNPEQYLDYDICALLSPDQCSDPDMGPSYREFCPEVCACRRPPNNASENTSA